MKTFLALGLCLASLSSHAADLTVTLKGATPGRGAVMLALYDAEATFLGKAPAARLKLDAPQSGGAVFKGLAPGRYAVTAYQDENANGSLDRNNLGQPVEAYGFSRNARPAYGPPTFADAAVTLGTTDQQIAIDLE